MKILHPGRGQAAILTIAMSLTAQVHAQCGIVADLTPGNANDNNIGGMVAGFGEQLFFSLVSPATGSELWKWDAVNGAHMVVDLAPGSATTRPEHITPCCTALGPRVFFSGFEIGHGHELYASDGTAAGTGRVKEIAPGPSSSLPFDFEPSGGRVFFTASDGAHGQELWVSDGTSAGTVRLSDFAPGTASGMPNDMMDLDGLVLFSAFDPATGRELFVSDGTPAGTGLLFDIEPGVSASDPREFTRMGDFVYFVATTSAQGRELWRSDGTANGTTLVADLFSSGAVGPYDLHATSDRLFFRGWVSSNPRILYVTDGTATGTVNLGVTAASLTTSGDRLFFTGTEFSTGSEPWVSDGTVAGTLLIADLVPGAFGSSPHRLVDCGPGVCFVADTTVPGELWFTDGTPGGTALLCTLDPGGNANPDMLTMCRGRLFMEAYDPIYGRELIGIRTPGASRAILGAGGRPDHPTITTAGGGVPILGTTVVLEGEGPSGYTGALAAGGPGLPMPAPVVPGFIEGGCDWVGLQAGTAIPVTALFTPSFSVPLAIPHSAVFEGQPLSFQVIWWHPTAAPVLQASNGLQLVPGTGMPH